MSNTPKLRTPLQYWETLERAFPPIEPKKLVGLKFSFFAGMSAMISLMGELRDAPISEEQKQSIYGEYVKEIHKRDGLHGHGLEWL